MRRVFYRVATSLDGLIAGPNGEIDWIIPDPTVDFESLYASVDTVLLGRRTYELTLQPGAPYQRQGVGTALVRQAAAAARARGATWLHVDYEPHLAGFYQACGFRATAAGLLRLRDPST
jgi:hypothetical protein